jgi:hypothetical protein
MLLEEEDMSYSIQSEEGGRALGFEQFRCQMLAIEGGESRRYDIVMLNLGGEVLLIAYLVEPQAYDRYHSGFENILQTLRIDSGYLAHLQSSREDPATDYRSKTIIPPGGKTGPTRTSCSSTAVVLPLQKAVLWIVPRPPLSLLCLRNWSMSSNTG